MHHDQFVVSQLVHSTASGLHLSLINAAFMLSAATLPERVYLRMECETDLLEL